MVDQHKLITKVKLKTDGEKLTINSLMYFVGDASVFTLSDLVRRKTSLMMAWLEGETLKMKTLYEPAGDLNVTKALKKSEKDVMLFMLSDNTVVAVSTKNPISAAAQIIKPKA